MLFSWVESFACVWLTRIKFPKNKIIVYKLVSFLFFCFYSPRQVPHETIILMSDLQNEKSRVNIYSKSFALCGLLNIWGYSITYCNSQDNT